MGGTARHWRDGKGGFRAEACRFFDQFAADYVARNPGRTWTNGIGRELQKAFSEWIADDDTPVESEPIPKAERAKGSKSRTRYVMRGQSRTVPAAGTVPGMSQSVGLPSTEVRTTSRPAGAARRAVKADDDGHVRVGVVAVDGRRWRLSCGHVLENMRPDPSVVGQRAVCLACRHQLDS